jgi:ribosomal protein S18 acetylase RimI-like enzyme
MTFRRLSDHPHATREISTALPWVHAGGQPYFDWLFGGSSSARRVLADWMGRPSSELFIGRAVVLVDKRDAVGGFIALPGDELPACRRQDALAAAAATSAEARASLLGRIRDAQGLFEEVSADELYLSRLGVRAHARGRGHGKRIVAEFLRQGIRQGFRRFVLDVSADNTPALELYAGVGFRSEHQRHAKHAGLTYMRMALDADNEFELEELSRAARSQPFTGDQSGR